MSGPAPAPGSAQPPPVRPTPTRYGRFFGTASNPVFVATGKSGYTPFPYQKESEIPTQALLDAYRNEEAYQRDVFKTFTTKELEESGCLGQASAKPSDLRNPIHKIMQMSNWQKSTALIGGGIPGTWSAQNFTVWMALRPVLSLATRLLFAPALFPWFDALLHSPFETLDPSQFKDGGDATFKDHLFAFRARAPKVIAASTFEITNFWSAVAAKIEIRLQFTDLMATPRKNGKITKRFGNSRPAYYKGDPTQMLMVAISLNQRLMLPLLHTGANALNEDERLVQHFFIAKILVHEFMHVAVMYLRSLDRPGRPVPTIRAPPEPFFEDEACNEAGKSMEASVFGGNMVDMWFPDLQQQKEMASWVSLSLMCMNWPDYKYFGKGKVKTPKDRTRYRFKEKFKENAVQTLWPVPTSFVVDKQETSHWDVHVSKFGAAAFKPKKIFGHVTLRGPTASDKRIKPLIAIGPDYDEWVNTSGSKVSTMEQESYPGKDDIRYGRLVMADLRWRPYFTSCSETAQKIRDAMDKAIPAPSPPPASPASSSGSGPWSDATSDRDDDADIGPPIKRRRCNPA